MKLPYRKKDYISEDKLTEHILSETRTVERLKARVFRAASFDQSSALHCLFYDSYFCLN